MFLRIQRTQISVTNISTQSSQPLYLHVESSVTSPNCPHFNFFSLTLVQSILWCINASVKSPHSTLTRTAVTASLSEIGFDVPSRPDHRKTERAVSGFPLSSSTCAILGWVAGPEISGRRWQASWEIYYKVESSIKMNPGLNNLISNKKHKFELPSTNITCNSTRIFPGFNPNQNFHIHPISSDKHYT